MSGETWDFSQAPRCVRESGSWWSWSYLVRCWRDGETLAPPGQDRVLSCLSKSLVRIWMSRQEVVHKRVLPSAAGFEQPPH